MARLPEKIQREIREYNLDELYILFEECIASKKVHKDDKKLLCSYIEKRITRLAKQKDYNDKSMPDHEYIAKWGIK